MAVIEVIPSRNVRDLSAVDYTALQFPLLVIYDRPTDYPDCVVIRLYDLDRPTNIIYLCGCIDAAERAIPHWFVNLGRQNMDDPKIVAVYI